MELRVTIDYPRSRLCLDWTALGSKKKIAHGTVHQAESKLHWRMTSGGQSETFACAVNRHAIRARLRRLAGQWPVADENIVFQSRFSDAFEAGGIGRTEVHEPLFDPWMGIEAEIFRMGDELQRQERGAFPLLATLAPEQARFLEKEERREAKKAQQRAELAARMRELERQRLAKERTARTARPTVASAPKPVRPASERTTPPVELRIAAPAFPQHDLFQTHAGLGGYLMVERASLVWVSNQSDDLLCLPDCAIERLDYQIRSALRVMGTLRGRALLSDEVGLGKTIEAGLVLKEYLTRGMVRRFLVLTVPSLIDQWAEELEAKFGLRTVTTNQPEFRADPQRFWTEENAVIASIHTFKQDNQRALAMQRPWEMLIVDEAHYLRNRTSKAWEAVNALPRQFLLLLTATPVQNSIEELYNLVTLLKPGQLPSPSEFRARFMNKDRPREPREPEELRELLGQVMIRNTRANAGIKLPSRRAETILYEPQEVERSFWEAWDEELRATLATLPAAQASLWGRLLLQAAGSSPAAWRKALTSFPDSARAERWSSSAPLQQSWEKKTAVLPALSKTEGGLVVFTQFLATQSALAEMLGAAGIRAWVLNGQTPPPLRQEIAQSFRQHGGVLLLTHSGTEGRNLQFCHRLVNFDLPWNPMEIEQRIGRLHRLGQERVVEIYNLVQAGTLQAHLLEILQEKLNLFELIVGETGLVLGERFSSGDFEEEVFRRWRDSQSGMAAAFHALGEELKQARAGFEEVKKLDETLFAHDYESL